MSASMSQRRWILPDVGQVLLRFLVVIGAMTAIVAAQAAGARPDLWWQGLLGWLAVLTALRPDSVAGVGLFAGAAYVWSMAPETLSPLVLLAAAGLVLAHVSALVAAQGPARMSVDGEQVRRWAARGLWLWFSAAAVWGLGVLVVEVPQPRLAYALGLTLLIVLAVATTRRISTRPGSAG